MNPVLLQFIVTDKQSGRTVRDVLQQEYGISRRLLIRAKYAGRIEVNGHHAYVTYKVQVGDTVSLSLPEEVAEKLSPEPIPITVRYEDEDILVLAKQAGIVVHPTGQYTSGTLANGVVHYWQSKGESRIFRPISRLDRDTTGLILIAQNQWMHETFSRMQKARTLRRTYQAVVHGIVVADEGVVDAPIGRSEQSIIERVVRDDGQEALTRYWVLARGNEMSLVELQLETGRTHQIRVHMSHIGHPLVGDDLYGGKRDLIDRQALHAYRLSFTHPRTKQQMQFVEPLPDDMAMLTAHIYG